MNTFKQLLDQTININNCNSQLKVTYNLVSNFLSCLRSHLPSFLGAGISISCFGFIYFHYIRVGINYAYRGKISPNRCKETSMDHAHHHNSDLPLLECQLVCAVMT